MGKKKKEEPYKEISKKVKKEYRRIFYFLYLESKFYYIIALGKIEIEKEKKII